MIRFNDPNIDLKDFEVVDSDTQTQTIKERYFVPYCKVKSGKEIFNSQEYSVSELPDYIYERFHSKI